MIAGLGCVDAVVPMEEQRPLSSIERWHPDLYIKGGDYAIETLRSKPLVEGYGGRCAVIPVRHDVSSSAIIRRVHEHYNYIVDPHTACAFKDLNPDRVSVVLATAHPAKFPDAIHAAIGHTSTHSALEALKPLPIVKHRLPAEEAAIKAFIVQRSV